MASYIFEFRQLFAQLRQIGSTAILEEFKVRFCFSV